MDGKKDNGAILDEICILLADYTIWVFFIFYFYLKSLYFIVYHERFILIYIYLFYKIN